MASFTVALQGPETVTLIFATASTRLGEGEGDGVGGGPGGMATQAAADVDPVCRVVVP